MRGDEPLLDIGAGYTEYPHGVGWMPRSAKMSWVLRVDMVRCQMAVTCATAVAASSPSSALWTVVLGVWCPTTSRCRMAAFSATPVRSS